MAKRLFAVLLVVMILFTACSTTPPQESKTPSPSPTASQPGEPSTGSGNIAKPGDESKVYVGVVAAQTGTNSATGQMSFNGAELAAEQINAAGGINGKKVELVRADEIDNLDASVNATSRLLSDERISAIIGSQYSQNCIAVMPQILEAKMPFFALGSNDAISKEKNPYVWQPRNFDAGNAVILATYGLNELGIKNPVVLCSTLPNSQGPGQAVRDWYAEKGYPVTNDRYFEYNEEEKNFAPIITQIRESGADGLYTFGNQNPLTLISTAIADNGLEIPRLANAVVTSNIIIDNAGKAADGWYSTSDWAYTLDTKVGQEFEKAYYAKYKQHTEGPTAYSYDSLYLLKEAMEIAGDCYDRDAINDAIYKIKGYEGVLGTYNTFEDTHSFLSEVFFVQIQDSKVILIDKVKYR
ncbi:MAG: ABC transporter substrate-binding protein [Acetivibrionales bacterium]|jgi:branched-chain amino acid transport system substrate-binding protein